MADEPARAIEFLEKAGARGLAMGAYQDTIDFLTRALSLAERVDVSRPRRGRWQRWLGEAAWGLGDIDACGAHVTAALATLDRPLPTSRGGCASPATTSQRGVARRGNRGPSTTPARRRAAARLSCRHYHAGDNLAMVAPTCAQWRWPIARPPARRSRSRPNSSATWPAWRGCRAWRAAT
jgi:hypothetical protein